MKKKFNYIFQSIFVFSMLCQTILLASEFQKTGTTGFVFLEIPVTARYMAMGETGMTLTDMKSDGLFINPALIALSDKKVSFNASHANWYVETTHQALGMTYQIPLFGTIGIQAVYFNFGEIEKTINPTSEQTGSYIDLGTYTAGAYALGVSYARALTDKFAFGATFKYVRETIDAYHADNIIADIGFIYQTGFKSLRLGTFLQNFGLESKYATEKFKMPQHLRMGISSEIYGSLNSPNHVTMIIEAVHPNDANERIHLGMETVLINSFILRAGYKFGDEEENLCVGGGLRFNFKGKSVGFDMAYLNHETLDTTIRYTLAMEF